MGTISRIGSPYIYVLVDIHNVDIDGDLVAPSQVVGSNIKYFDVIMLQCKCSARFSHRKRKGSSSRACGVTRGHRDGGICALEYMIDRSCIEARASDS